MIKTDCRIADVVAFILTVLIIVLLLIIAGHCQTRTHVRQLPDSLDALGKPATVTPRMATGRDYLDTPTTLDGLSKFYRDAGSSLVMQMRGEAAQPEKLVPIAKDGTFGTTTVGGGKDASGAMHASASIPADSQAIIHTHPFGIEPVPSQDDYNTATKIGKPNFVMSRNAIYVAMPGGSTKNPVKVADIKPGKGGKLAIKWN